MLDYLQKGSKVIDTMITGVIKYDADHNESQLKARCCMRGDQMDDVCVEDKTSPAIRCEGIKCCEANKVLRRQDEVCFDYVGAYLQSRQLTTLIARAPAGHRNRDEDEVEYYWLMKVPLYGQADAGLRWNEEINQFLTSDKECRMSRGDAEPCIYDRAVGDNDDERVNMSLYVDDGKLYIDPTEAARAEGERIRKKIESRWNIKFQETNQKETYMLSANILRHSSSHTSIGMRTYLEKAASEHLPKSLESYPASWTNNPCDKNMVRDYEAALSKTDMITGPEADRYGTIVGVLQFACSFRPDISYPVGVGGRCRTYPTAKMLEHMERVLVYAVRNKDIFINYTATQPNSHKLRGASDSDWSVRRSTTGFVIILACGAIAHASRRQHCIALSSTEAELMALADLAVELLYIREVLKHIGHLFENELELETKDPEAHRLVHSVGDIMHGATEIGVDNSGAYSLCLRTTNGKNSRHVERKCYRMRELRIDGYVQMKLIPTKEMCADMLTKPLDDVTFQRHRATVMNLAASAH